MIREPSGPGGERGGHRILILDLFRAYADLFPQEAGPLWWILVETTWGATASREVAALLEGLAHSGRTGNLPAFQEGLERGVAALRSLHADLVAGRVAPDANVGPALWLLNRSFLVPRSAIRTHRRDVPLAVNLNTASVPELMTIEGIGPGLARAIVARRREMGFFTSLEDLAEVPGVTRDLLQALREMQREMEQAGGHERD